MLSKKGFTFLELVVVLAIISILFSISYASYQGYHQRARVYSAKQHLSSIVSKVEVFRANAGFYLPNLRQMHIPIEGVTLIIIKSFVRAVPELFFGKQIR